MMNLFGKNPADTSYSFLKNVVLEIDQSLNDSLVDLTTIEKVKNILNNEKDQLIGDLIVHPEHKKTYTELGKKLRQLDLSAFKEVQPIIGSILRVARALKNDDAQTLSSHTRQMSKSKILREVSLTNSNFVTLHLPENVNELDAMTSTSFFYDLQLPEDLARIRTIENPEVKNRIIAMLINRQEMSIDELGLTKKELKEIGPHLTFFKCHSKFDDVNAKFIDVFDSWSTKEVNQLISSCTKLKTLNIKTKKLTIIPSLKHLETLDCSYCEKLSVIKELPNCLKVNCKNCSHLKQVDLLPKCQEANFYHCYDLEEIPGLPDCLEIDCTYCISLREIGELPKCRTLSCWRCNLEEFPDLPECINFNCSECSNLKRLGSLPKCENLNCNGSWQLTSIPSLPNCINLNCNGCRTITRLKDLYNCKKINCNTCSNLTEFIPPVLPSCVDLKCYICPKLRTLPELPHCRKLDCHACLLIPNTPDMPECTFLDCEDCPSLKLIGVLSPHIQEQALKVSYHSNLKFKRDDL